jgi:hydroxybutyrate-dimer hydrolase
MKVRKLLAAVGVVVPVAVVAVGGVVAASNAGMLHGRLGAMVDGVLDIQNRRPDFVAGEIHSKYYDGVADDLLTGGAGLEGLKDAKPPGYYDNYSPREDELRKNAIHSNYRALFDTTEAGGFGRLLGPNIGADGTPDGTDGTVAGWEYLAYEDDGSGKLNVTMMVQVPEDFDPDNACIVTAPSSGSRGVYGAVGTTGEWALKRGCALAYTDKGTGTGMHSLSDDSVSTMRGRRMEASRAGEQSNFTADISADQRFEYNRQYPHRFAYKHAHSQRNAEAHWGEHVLHALEFSFYVLNERYGMKVPGLDVTLKTIRPQNTTVIAFGVSNGGGAAVRAAEQDSKGLIDGVAVSEPTLQLQEGGAFTIVQGDKEFKVHSKSLYDYTTFQSLYQPCASTAAANARAPFNLIPRMLGQARCKALAQHGLLKSATPAEQAAEAQKLINDYGFLVEQNIIAPSHMAFDVYPNIAVNYGYAYGRFSVLDNLCGYSFAAVDAGNAPGPTNKEMIETMFAYGSGIPPTGPVQIIYNDAANGPIKHVAAVSKSTGLPDMGLDGQLCLRALATGKDPLTGQPLTGEMLAKHQRLKQGIEEMRNSGKVNGKPMVIVNGRSDAILPPNHNARAYYAMNKLAEGGDNATRYYEVANAQHLDALIQFPGFTDKYVPIHYYLTQAADALLAHLRDGEPLPPSQVVHAVPRKPGEALGMQHLPALKSNPGSEAITWSGNQLRIPD